MSTALSNLSPAELHRKKHNQLIRLADPHQANPYPVMEEFFSYYHLTDTRKLIWDWLQAGLTSKHGNFNSGKQRSDLFFFYQKIEELLEAAYLLLEQYQMRVQEANS